MRWWLAVGIFLLAVVSCESKPQTERLPSFGTSAGDGKGVYLFGVHPLHNPKRLFEVYHPILQELSDRIPGHDFRLEASRNYQEYEKKLYAGHFHFALPNPYQTLESLKHGYRVFGKMGDDDSFRGTILVRRDSKIRRVADLKGKTISYPAPTALAATMMPKYYLQTHGLDVQRETRSLYVGSQESSIMNVYLGNVAAGATWPVPWRAFVREHPKMAQQLVVRWQTAPLRNNGLVAREDVSQQVVQQVGQVMFNLQDTAQGREMLARIPLTRFEAATEATYQPVREFLRDYARKVGPEKAAYLAR